MMEIHLRLKRNKKKEWSIFDQSIIKNMKYIRSVYNKEYNDGNHDESIYTIYLYTSHYIENINYDKSFSDKKILDILYMQILFHKMI